MYLLTIIPLWIACGQSTALLIRDIEIDLPQRIVIGFGCSFLVTLMLSALLLLFNSFSLFTLISFQVAYITITVFCIFRFKFYADLIIGELKTFAAIALFAALFIIGCKVFYGFSLSGYMASYFTHGSFHLNSLSEYPVQSNYGNAYILPFLFLKHSLVFSTMLLSGGDRFQYFYYGIPVLSTIISTFVCLGSYLFFRLFLSRPFALILGAVFLFFSLNYKIIDVRADCIAWTPAFAFLILFVKCLKNTKSKAIYWITPGLFVSTVLLHGVAALIALSIAAGIWGSFFLNSGLKEMLKITKWGVILSVTTFLLTGFLYYSLHYKYTDPDNNAAFEIYDKTGPKIGEPDPAVEYINIVQRNNFKALVKIPPYVTLKENLTLALTNPIISPLKDCDHVFNWFFILSGGISCVLILIFNKNKFLIFDKNKTQIQPLIFAFISVFIVIFLYSVRLNYTSASYFPWAIFPRRLATYQHTAMAMLYSIFIIRFIKIISDRYLPKFRQITSIIMILAGFILFAVPSISFINSDKNHSSSFTSQNLKELLIFLNENGRPGENAVANFRTLNYMGYLANMNFVSEGRGPYQVYRLISKNVSSLKDIRNFFINPNIEFLNKYNIKFIILSKVGDPPGEPSFLFPSFNPPHGLYISYQNDEFIVLSTKN